MPSLDIEPTDIRLRPLADKPSGRLIIHEIYRSIQGESRYAGLPCVFVRLSACSLRCKYCDTPYAFHEGKSLSLDEVVERALALGDPLVEITGGEPLLQSEAIPLMTRLLDEGRTVLLETGGAIDISHVDPRVHIILDVKTPGSGEVEANLTENLSRLKPSDEVKYVVTDRADFDWAVEHIRRHRLSERVEVLVGPSFGQVCLADLAEWILASRLPIRLQHQLHKVIWPADARGV